MRDSIEEYRRGSVVFRDSIENDSRGSVVLRDNPEKYSRGSVVLRDSIENDNRGSIVLLCVVKVMTCIYTDKQVALELRGSSFSSLSH